MEKLYASGFIGFLTIIGHSTSSIASSILVEFDELGYLSECLVGLLRVRSADSKVMKNSDATAATHR